MVGEIDEGDYRPTRIRVEQSARFWWFAFVISEPAGGEGMAVESGPYIGLTRERAVRKARRAALRERRRLESRHEVPA